MTGPQMSKAPRPRLLEPGYLGVGRTLCRVAGTGLPGWVLFELTCRGKSTGQKGGDGSGHGNGSRATALAVDVEYEGEEGVEGDTWVWGLSSWENGQAIF